MLPTDIANTLIVLGMFAIRVGVPVAITLALGYWLEKKLRPPEVEKPVITPKAVRTGKIIQLHCWDLKRCDTTKQAQCAASRHPELPCWLALQVEGEKVREECFTCGLYKSNQIAA